MTLLEVILDIDCILVLDPKPCLNDGLGDNITFLFDLIVEAGLGLSIHITLVLYY